MKFVGGSVSHFTLVGDFRPGISRRGPPKAVLGSEADISQCNRHVRYYPKSGHLQCTSACPLWARSGHQLIVHSFLKAIQIRKMTTRNWHPVLERDFSLQWTLSLKIAGTCQ